MTWPLKITGPGELIAAVPHVMGFKPEESVLLVPSRAQGPWARLDQQYTDDDIVDAALVLAAPFLRDQLDVAVICFTHDRAAAERTCQALTRLMGDQVLVAPKLWVTGDQWTDLATGATRQMDDQVRTRMAAESVFQGRRMPAASREAIRQNLRGTPRTMGGGCRGAAVGTRARRRTSYRLWPCARGASGTRGRDDVRDRSSTTD